MVSRPFSGLCPETWETAAIGVEKNQGLLVPLVEKLPSTGKAIFKAEKRVVKQQPVIKELLSARGFIYSVMD